MTTVIVVLGVVAAVAGWFGLLLNASMTAAIPDYGNRFDRLTARVLFGKGEHPDMGFWRFTRGLAIGAACVAPLLFGLAQLAP